LPFFNWFNLFWVRPHPFWKEYMSQKIHFWTHFSFFARLMYNLFFLNFCNINSTCVACSFVNLESTKMSSL
jgi:hypothetical protein